MGRNPLTIEQQGPGNSPSELQNSAAIHFWLGSDPNGTVTLEISTLDGSQTATYQVEAHAGINRFFWDLRMPPSEAEMEALRARMAQAQGGGQQRPGGFGARGSEVGPGTYLLRLTSNGRTVEGTVAVRDDPGLEGVLPSVR
jgi:hypothetical protein